MLVAASRLEAPGSGVESPVVSVPTLAVGYGVTSGFFLEGRARRMRADVRHAAQAGGDAPLNIGLRATLLEAAIGYRPTALRLGPVQPQASVGAVRARIRDAWTSDTPTEHRRTSTLGMSAAVGAALTVHRRLAVVTRGTYYSLGEDEARPQQAIDLPTLMWELGVRFRW